MNRTIKLRKLAYVMLSLSFVSLIIGVYLYIKKSEYLSTCTLITCKITKIDEPTRGDALLTFTDVNGNYKPFLYAVSYDPSEESLDYKVGETYEVYYDRKNAGDSEIKGIWINYLAPLILGITGITFLIDFPVLLFVGGLVEKRKNPNSLENLKKEVISE